MFDIEIICKYSYIFIFFRSSGATLAMTSPMVSSTVVPTNSGMVFCFICSRFSVLLTAMILLSSYHKYFFCESLFSVASPNTNFPNTQVHLWVYIKTNAHQFLFLFFTTSFFKWNGPGIFQYQLHILPAHEQPLHCRSSWCIVLSIFLTFIQHLYILSLIFKILSLIKTLCFR